MGEASDQIFLICRSCGWRGEEKLNIYSCPRCGSPLELEYSIEDILPEPREILKCRSGIWCFSKQLPSYKYRATLGEGMTRVIAIGLENLDIMVKAEYQNPTGSFKDRGSALAVSMALSKGAKIIVEDSSGNAGIATSCYSRAYGLRAVIVAPKTAPRGKLDLLSLCGAEIILAETRGHAADLAPRIAVEKGGAYLPHTWLPHFVEAMKTIAYEIHYQVDELPDAIFIPTSSGTLLLGLYRGFKELVRYGYRKKIPKLIAVQTTSFHPLYRALKGEEMPLEDENLADGISLDKPPRLKQMIDAIKETSGDVVVVSNNEIKHSLKLLLARGLIVEPTSATSIAGIIKAIQSGNNFNSPMAILTGSGLKMPQRLIELAYTK
ncbi:MAG: pyridoxal-phosphate dependent enzyme [Sulfolobales archaeon]